MADKRCLVAVVHNTPMMFTGTAMSLVGMFVGNRDQLAKETHGFACIDFTWEAGFPRVDAMRNAVLEKAITAGYTHVLFLDGDMKWPTDTLLKMLAFHDKGIVSGLYCLKNGSFMPVAMKDPYIPEGKVTTQWYRYDLDYRAGDGLTDADGLRDVDVIGMGCALIPLSAVTAMGPRPWFHYEDDEDGWPTISEDVPFCRKAKAAGARIAWAPAVKCEHGSVTFISEQWHIAATDGAFAALSREIGKRNAQADAKLEEEAA